MNWDFTVFKEKGDPLKGYRSNDTFLRESFKSASNDGNSTTSRRLNTITALVSLTLKITTCNSFYFNTL